MQTGFPSKMKKTKLIKICQSFLEPRHLSIGTDMCCHILLLASGFKRDEFKIGREEIHIRSGKSHFLDEILEANDKVLRTLALKFNKGFVAFQCRIIYIRLCVFGKCMFSFPFTFLFFQIQMFPIIIKIVVSVLLVKTQKQQKIAATNDMSQGILTKDSGEIDSIEIMKEDRVENNETIEVKNEFIHFQSGQSGKFY